MNDITEITPINAELPSEFAEGLGVIYAKSVSSDFKKENGQFFTPLLIARLMASLSTLRKPNIKILDPGAGTAILSCAVIEKIVEYPTIVTSIELVIYETDCDIITCTNSVLSYLKSWISEKGIELNFTIKNLDFILDNSFDLFNEKGTELYDIIISNPPYFKLGSDDPRNLIAKDLISGQPNIYSFFMGFAARLLNNNGELIFITPRSFASGEYFKAFRNHFFSKVQLDRIHLFNSRKDTFNRDKVLQETVIIKALRKEFNSQDKVEISCCSGLHDIDNPSIFEFRVCDLINFNSKEKVLHLPTSDEEVNIMNLVGTWSNILSDFDISISTGPVVSFRATEFMLNEYQDKNTIPLFWLHNIRNMILEWPRKFKEKCQFILVSDDSKRLLIPNKNYIFLRRFSAKEDKNRLIAAPYFCNSTKSDYIGVENKVNYIYRKNGHLKRDETIGLCALLNSELFDTYFRIFNGNVNVSATELRTMKFPSLNDIRSIGNKIILSNDFSLENINLIVNNKYSWK